MADCCSSGRCSGHIPLEKIIAECDKLFNLEKKEELGEHLRFWRRRAAELGDKKGELSLLSELMGHYRLVRDKDRGLAAVRDGFALIEELNISGSVSAGTIFINGATALQSFGECDEALAYYRKAEKSYLSNLPPRDVRLAPLYNNMASSSIDAGNFEQAEKYYLLAADILNSAGKLMDLAVTHINLAQLYDALDPEDERIEQHLDSAMACFENQNAVLDGYYAHTCRKCAPAFGYFGRFMDENFLQKKADEFYAGN